MDLVVRQREGYPLPFYTPIHSTTKSKLLMEVLLIEKETLDCILDEHELLCNMVIVLANRLRRKETADMMTSSEVCDFLHIGLTTLQSLRNGGKIGYVRIDDGSIRYPVTEVIRYMERNGINYNRGAYGE